MPDLPKEIDANMIKAIFEDLKENLEKMAQGKNVNADEITKTKTFFNGLRESTLSDSLDIINGRNESRSLDKWELRPES